MHGVFQRPLPMEKLFGKSSISWRSSSIIYFKLQSIASFFFRNRPSRTFQTIILSVQIWLQFHYVSAHGLVYGRENHSVSRIVFLCQYFQFGKFEILSREVSTKFSQALEPGSNFTFSTNYHAFLVEIWRNGFAIVDRTTAFRNAKRRF